MPDYRAAVVTVSDACHQGKREDLSGPAVASVLTANGFTVAQHTVVPDEQDQIRDTLVQLCEGHDLVVTTGGTGIAARDVTPEATRAVCDRFIDGIPELMRARGLEHTLFAVLTRSLCGIRGHSIILNLPGNPNGARESLAAVVGLLAHALNLLHGNTAHPPHFHSRTQQP
jgi:molybdenum cofactor synthesis domain-containing protein